MKNNDFYFSNEACDIFYNEKLSAVETRWRPVFVQGEALYEILNAIVELIALKQSSVVIADARKMKVISGRDQEWIGEVWYPNAVKAGFYYEALIVSKDTFNERTIKNIVNNYYNNVLVKTKYCYAYEDAVEWILSLQKQDK